MDTTTSGAWLKKYLADSVRRNLCTKITCTPCGALDFRRGLLGIYASITGHPQMEIFDHVNATGILRALAAVERPDDPSEGITAAVRCILYDLWSVLQPGTVRSTLAGAWAGSVLERMEEHNRQVQAHRQAQAYLEDPVRVRQRREEKKRLNQERHRQRLAVKAERDRIWREKHDGGE